MPDMRMQQGRRRSLPVIVLIIFPCIGRQILNGIIQEPHPAPGSLHQLLHDSIFQIGGFKGTLLVYPLVYVGLPARARPNLCDVAVHRGNVDECSLRAHDFPLGIIQQALQDQGQHALRRRGRHQYRRPGGRQPRSGRRLIIHFLDNAQNVRPRRFGNSPFSMDCHGNCRLRNTGTPGNVLVCHLCHRCYSLIHEDKPESVLL